MKGRKIDPNATLGKAVRDFYAALKRKEAQIIKNPPVKRELVVTVDVTGFTLAELRNLRGAITEACYPRDQHYPARAPSFKAVRRG